MKWLITTALSLLILAGCATDQRVSGPALKAGSGRLVVFRDPGATAMFAAPSIYVNGSEVGKLYSKSYVDVSLEPGDYEFKSEGNFFNWPGPPRVIPITVRPNRTTYLQLVVEPGGGPAIVNHRYVQRSDSGLEWVTEKYDRGNN